MSLKEVTAGDENQAIGELFAANAISSEKPVVFLTDFQRTYTFFWLTYIHHETFLAESSQTSTLTLTVCGTKFGTIHQAATFARTLLEPEQLTNNHDQERIQNHFPFFEKRARVKNPVTEDSYDEDIANLDDFEDEMTPQERISHEMTKKLRKMLPFVPNRFHDYYPTRGPWPTGMYS